MMIKYYLILLCISSITYAGIKETSPTSFSYVFESGEEEFNINGYIRQRNISRKAVTAIVEYCSKKGSDQELEQELEQELKQATIKKFNLTPDVYIQSTTEIETVYIIQMTVKEASFDFGVQPGIAFIVKMSDKQHLLICKHKERARLFSKPSSRVNPLLYHSLYSNNQMVVMNIDKSRKDAFIRWLKDAGSEEIIESGFTCFITTNIPYFKISGLGDMEVNGKKIRVFFERNSYFF